LSSDPARDPARSLASDLLRRASAKFATGVAVVSTLAPDGAPHGLTINSFCSLSLTPPLVMVAIDRACVFLGFFELSGHFAVNILDECQADLSDRFAQIPEGRFKGVDWRTGVTGSPILPGSLVVIECETRQIIDAGDHRVLIGEAVAAEIGEGRPLVFFSSAYANLDRG
jgi:flavin reductase (DIM6/NTAB) family NADH-FMN oxidoreductase RutF